MIKIARLNKYYFKGSEKELHVINDVNLTLPNTGIVTLFGASGSGKTTLLNVIGGLDKALSGEISYDDKTFTKYEMKKIDEFRSIKIGYVFQNYLLLENQTVYDNLKVALEIIGIYDEEEQKKRIEYALSSVGLYKFRKKKARHLSGGQMQRVSIARCLVKDADIIIADEPTGNIDSENTIQVMNILKKLSLSKLVILVTHEEEMANYYSDRIIRIKDGKVISDDIVTSRGKLSSKTDRLINLQDYSKKELLNNDLEINLYQDEAKTQGNITLVIKNDTVYIKSDKKIVNINESSIDLIDEVVTQEEEKKIEETPFDTSWFKGAKEFTKKHKLATTFKNGFKEFISMSRSQIAFLFVFLFLGIILGVSSINIANYTTIDYSKAILDDDYYVAKNNDDYDTFYAPFVDSDIHIRANDQGFIKNAFPIKSFSEAFKIQNNFINFDYHHINGWAAPFTNDLKIIAGTKPTNNNFVIGKTLADDLLVALDYEQGDYDKLLGLSFKEALIDGVCDKETMSVYQNNVFAYSNSLEIDNSILGNVSPNLIGLLKSYQEIITTSVELDSLKPHEIIVSESFKTINNINISDTFRFNSTAFTVKGFFEANSSYYCPNILTNNRLLMHTELLVDNGEILPSIVSTSLSYLPKTEYTLTEGVLPTEEKTCIAHESFDLNIGDIYHDYKVVGKYKNNYETCSLGNNLSYIGLVLMSEKDHFKSNHGLVLTFNDGAEQFYNDNGYQILPASTYQKTYLKKDARFDNLTLPITIIVLTTLVVLYTYFSNRSKLSGEIYNIGVYRSLGMSKKDLINQKIVYNFFQTSFSSVLGFIIAWGVYYFFAIEYGSLFGLVGTFQPLIIFSGLILLYVINIFIGILPTISLLKNTPAEINSKYDI